MRRVPHSEFGRSLLLLRLLEHAIETLIRRVAASLGILGRAQSLIGRTLRARSQLSRLVCRSLSVVGCGLRSFGRGAYGVQVVDSHGSAAGGKSKTAKERR